MDPADRGWRAATRGSILGPVKSSIVAAATFLIGIAGCAPCETSNGATDADADGGAEAGLPPAPCDGRGQVLEDVDIAARVDGGASLSLKFVEGEPMPPVVGNNSWLFALELDGVPFAGAAEHVIVTPFMPDHGHGTPTAVVVTETSAGSYQFEPVHTRMAGFWEIRIDVDTADVDATLVFGVCVE